MPVPTRARRALAVAGALAATLSAAGCGGYDRDAYCAAVREVRQPAELGGSASGDDSVPDDSVPDDSGADSTVGPASPTAEDEAALRGYLEQVRGLEGLAPREDEEQWRTLREGLESVMTEGRVDVDKVEKAQRQLTLMARAADTLDTSLVGECGVGLSDG